jgi:hypothetical protein
MILSGIWYYRLPSHTHRNNSYKLLSKSPPTFAYSHLIIASKILMLPCATRKSEPRFSMAIEVKDKLVATIEDKHEDVDDM